MSTNRTNSRKTRGRDRRAKTSKSARSARTAPAKSRGTKNTRNLLLREIDPDVLKVLQARAARSGRSLQQELHVALQRDARRNFAEARASVDDWHARLAGRDVPDSAELIREDRDR